MDKVEYVDYAEAWYKIWCPYCGKANWVCNGNEQDITGIDIDGIKCFSCLKEFLIGVKDEVIIEMNGGEYPAGNWNIEGGREKAE